MTIEFTHWPPARERLYREKGYWIDKPLTRALEEQAAMRPDAPTILCGERRFTYAELDRLSSNLASRLAAAGIGKGDTALVQLPNIAEFYIVFFALMKAGIAPVNALFSHRKLELGAYASQIEPRLLIGSRQHELFMDDAFARDLGKNLSAPLLTLLQARPTLRRASTTGSPRLRTKPFPSRQPALAKSPFSSFPAAAPARRNSSRARIMIMITACAPARKSAR